MGSVSEPLPSNLPGGYRLLRYLGRGAYGEVWHAEAPGGVEVAIKIIPRTLPSGEPETELKALHLIKGLRHQNLLSLQAFFPLPDRLVIVLELADGCLRRRMIQCRGEGLDGIPPAELLVYMREAAEALDFLHGRQLLHRDIKPDNLLLLGNHVKVADYGLARVMDKSSLQTATTVGTPSYMAPEVFQGKVSQHSDQYSLAITYAELRLGRPPLLAENLGQMMYQHLFAEPDLGPLPGAERQVLLRALSKDPTERFPSCSAMVQALMETLPETLAKGSAASPTPSAPSTAKPGGGPGSTDIPLEAASTLVPVEGMIHTAVDRVPPASKAEWRRGHGGSRQRWLLPALLAGLACAAGLALWACGVLQQPDAGPKDAQAAVNEKIQTAPQPVKGSRPPITEAGKKTQPAPQPAPPAPEPVVPEPPPEPKPIPPAPPPPPAVLRMLPIKGVTVGAGQAAVLEVRVQRENCHGPVRLEIAGLPAGVGAQPVVLAEGDETVRLKLRAQDDAPEGATSARVLAQLGTIRQEQTAVVTVRVTPRLRVIAPRQAVMGAGQLRYFAVSFEKRKITGPITLDMGNLPEGIKIPGILPIRIPPGRDSVCLVLSAAGDVALGDHALDVRATAAGVRVDSVLHLTVVPSRPAQEQLAEDNAAVGLAPRDPVAYLNRALTYRRSGDFTKAFADYDEALRLDPTFARVYHSRGNAHTQLKEYDKAVADLAEAIRLDPAGYPVVYCDRGNVFRLKGESDRALADYGEALRLDPTSAVAHKGRALVYENKRDYERAVAEFDEAIRLDPKDSVAFGQRAVVHVLRKEVDSALTDFSEAIRLNPKYAWAMNYRGTLYGQKGDWKKAVADFEQAMKVAPKFALPYRNRGNYYRLQKDYDRAIADLTEAIRLDPRYANAYELRVLAYRAKGDGTRADEDIQKARQLQPPAPAPPPAWVPLFNGKDLTGWKTPPTQAHGWGVENGLLTGRAKQGSTHLFTTRGDFANFHLRADVAVNDNGNSGIFFRCPFGLPKSGVYPGGFEAQILHRFAKPGFYLTGSLYDLVKGPTLDLSPDEWFHMEILAVGNDLTIKVNGRITAHYVVPQKQFVKQGYLALQATDPRTTVVRFRKIEIQQLPPTPQPAAPALKAG